MPADRSFLAPCPSRFVGVQEATASLTYVDYSCGSSCSKERRERILRLCSDTVQLHQQERKETV